MKRDCIKNVLTASFLQVYKMYTVRLADLQVFFVVKIYLKLPSLHYSPSLVDEQIWSKIFRLWSKLGELHT